MNFWASSSDVSSLDEVGGKGLHLQKLVRWEARVSPFFVLTTECFKYYKNKGELPRVLDEKLKLFFNIHPTIVLRSSMIGEDHLDASFAGLFETLLDVNEENWKQSLLKIYESVNTKRVMEYLERKKIKVELLMAVVVQAQVNVEKSGVLFSRSPVTPTAVVAIDAAFGMGEGVVSGHSLVDHYQFTRCGELVLEIKNNENSVLKRHEQLELIHLAKALEAKINGPCDIEWGYQNGELYVFQIRPITRSFEPLTYFVDTNLAESYPGTVSPFTAQFVQKAYHNVFRESAMIMGAHGTRLELLDFHYERLISHVDNHLYYNLEHYYAVLRALPGGEKNIENWHKMIGGKISSSEVPRHDTELSHVEVLQGAFSLIKMGLRHKTIFSQLLKRMEKEREEILSEQFQLKTSQGIINHLSDLIERPLGFGLTVVNDVFIMIGLGVITRAFKKRGIKEENVIDLLKTSQGLDSTRPLELFNTLVGSLSDEFISDFEKLAEVPGANPYSQSFVQLRLQGKAQEVKKVEEFLSLYGERSFEELKLESLPLRNNPPLFIQLLKWAKANQNHSNKSRPSEVKVRLNWIETKILEFTRQCIEVRETTRLWRGKYYHLFRSLVLELGEQLKSEDRRWQEFSVLDFFSLNHTEWMDYRDGKLDFESVKNLILERKSWQTKRQQYPEVIQWVESEKLPELNPTSEQSDLSGQGVSPGITEGVALVLDNPNDALISEVKDFILVTKNTDPAWVYIMSRSLGMISEKGSLLSHTAIIGRELAIPTVVGVKGATLRIQTGDRLRMDATTGKIEVL